jgi:hypothetical protein
LQQKAQRLSMALGRSIRVKMAAKMHKFAQFLKRRFCYAAPALAGPGRSAQSAQKEAV